MLGFGGQGVGLDIDRGALKAVQVARSGSSYTLQQVGYRRLPAGTVTDGEVADHDLLASELKEFWSSHAFKGKSVLLGLANQKVVVRLLEFPRMSQEDLQGVIRYEAQDSIPMPLDEAIMDYVLLGPGSEGAEDLDRVLIVAAHREMISRYTSAVRAAGLRPTGVDVKALSLVRSTLPSTLFEDGGATLLLDVGSEISNLVVSQDSTPTMARFLPGGSNFLAQSVADTTGLPEEEAEEQLTNSRVRLGSEPEVDVDVEGMEDTVVEGEDPAFLFDVRRGLEDAVQALAEDVQRSIEYHYSQPGSRDVTQVVVSGEGAMVSGFDSYLGELIGVPVQRGTPLSRLSANKSNVSDEQLALMEPVLAVALGLAVEDT
ncbi:MAG: type IV pilus assembly protein PilM [Rubrobacter sp.]|nr:type IV pilus assembly protein PilM [Rubrobacter sp.]